MSLETKKTEQHEFAADKPETNEIIIKDDKGNLLAEYDKDMLNVIKSTVAKDATDEELYMFLNVASSYNLNPFKKEIWFVKMGKSNSIMVSRDGYVKIVKEDPRFLKLQSDAVYENDEFNMEWEGMEIKTFTHKHGASDRGNIIGAWAGLKFIGLDPLYVYVPFKEYNKGGSVWGTNKSAMIRKVAEKEVCRLGGDVSGLHISEEMPEGYGVDSEPGEAHKSAVERAKEKLKNVEESEELEFIDVEVGEE